MPSSDTTIHVAIELSTSLWLVAARLPGSDKCRMHRIAGGDTSALLTLLGELRLRGSTKANSAEIACCFEAGRDGFWLYRLLTANNIRTWVVEPSSILVNRRARRAKTDRLDAIGLLRILAAYLEGDLQVCSMVRVPTCEIALKHDPPGQPLHAIDLHGKSSFAWGSFIARKLTPRIWLLSALHQLVIQVGGGVGLASEFTS